MTYKIIDNIFAKLDEKMSAAEAHGVATGMLSIDSGMNSEDWLLEVVSENSVILVEERELLSALFERTRELLLDDGFEFDLLLPDDDCPISQMAESLREWCQGFLFGIGCGGDLTNWHEENSEILKDILECTKLDTDLVNDDDENAFMEIHQYLRTAVLLILEQQNNGRQDPILH